MADFTTAVWFPVLTLLLGYATKSGSDWIEFKRTVRREREARAENRQEKISERRGEFQRTTLLELQEVAHRMARKTAQIEHADEMAYRQGTGWRSNMVGEEIAEGFRECQARTMLLSARVLDEKTRVYLEEFRACCTVVTFSKERDVAKHAMNSINPLLEQLNEHIGGKLREIDAADKALLRT